MHLQPSTSKNDVLKSFFSAELLFQCRRPLWSGVIIFTYIFRNQNMLKYSEMIGAAGYRSKYADVNVSSESSPSRSTRPKCRLAKLCCCPLSRNSRSIIRWSPSDIPRIKNFIVIFTFHFRDAWPCQLMQKYVPVSKVMSCPNCLKRVPP